MKLICYRCLGCFHIKKVGGCSWVRIEKYDEITFEPEKMSYCDIELMVDWKNLIPIEKDCNAPLRIASFDIECTSVDGQFPMARRKSDQVIQIGTTYTKLGESIPYRQHIVCLDTTDPVEGAVTEWYSDERDLILAWKKEIIKSDCDILTGYNIFFFDEKYIYDRCDLHLGLKIEISMLSKLKNRECNFRDFKLASSAMGENLIRYWDTPGRVHVDLMKDVQKTYNLSSYKLDDVASNFIRGKIEKFDKKYNKKKDHFEYKLYCANVDDIYDNDYIHVEHVKSFVSDYVGHKYLIDNVDKENKTLTFTSDADIEEVDEGCLFWSQAKDDVTAQDIFSLQKGSSADRSIVAKYCVKDCRLVNVLVNKLEVVTKNIEMANVCYVPLSYLFVRGQGVKLFSLCLKLYREHGYLFPVVTKPKEDDGGYEGAIVFDPIPSVYYEPLVTKDYASLYPSSILQKNMSHETMVRSSDYDELEDIEYYNAQYKQNDGNVKHVRFAKKDGKLGVVPTILDTLLKERKSVKKQMKVEKDNFKYKILDAKQLALKITANSLYGQLGAPTSPVFMKAIAACTTSTGREMLNFAKKYDEEILPGFMNGIKHAYKKNDMKMVNKILRFGT
jgi:DNA polymerase elongation subunit (family B)